MGRYDRATPPGVAKLPKWAQTYIENLNRDLRHAERRLAGDVEGAIAFADPLGDNTALPNGWAEGQSATVRFVLPKRHDHGELHFDVHLEGHELVVYVSGSGGGTMLVTPSTSNAIRVRGETAWETNRRRAYEQGLAGPLEGKSDG